MTMDCMEIITRRGTILPLDRRRRDALAEYARQAANRDGQPAQTWVRNTWGFSDYEAKDLLRGNASEALWERIVKHRNGGWSVVIPILGAVIGQRLEDFIENQARRASEEARAWEAEEARLEALAARISERRRLGGEGS